MTVVRNARVALFLAARSFARGNANVTLMTVLMIAVVFISTMFLPSLLTGAISTINGQIRKTMASDLIVTSADDTSISHASAYLARIAGLDGVAATTGVRRVGTQIAYGEESNAWGVEAIDPTSFAEVFTTPDHVIEGKFLEPDDLHGIVLGIDVAGMGDTGLRTYSTSLKTVHTGDRVEVTLAGGVVETFTVRGIYRNRFPLSDQGAYITTAAADALQRAVDPADSVKRLYDAVDALSSALEKAASPADDLAGAAAALAQSARRVADSAAAIAGGASDLESGVAGLASGAADLDASATTVADGAASLADASNELSGQMATAVEDTARRTAADAASVATAAAQLAQSCPLAASPDYCSQVVDLAASLSGLATEAGASATAVETAGSSMDVVAGSAGDLADGAAALAEATSQLSRSTGGAVSGADSLAASASELASGADRMAAGADSLSDSAERLADQLRKGSAEAPDVDQGERDDLLETLAEAGVGPGKDTATRVFVRAAPGVTSARLERAVTQVRPGMEFQSPDQVASAIQDQIDTFALINNIMRVISLVVAAITVFILTYVELTNRRRQIGIERAIGIRSAAIVGSYVVKSAINAIIGVLVGAAVFSFVLIPLVARHPFPFPNGDVSLVTEPATSRSNTVILLVVAVAAALVPAVNAVRMKILDAIWGR